MTIAQGSTRQAASRENNHLTPMSPSAVPDLPADRHPALVYLASVAPGTRPSVWSGLQVIAELLSGGMCDLRTM